METFTETSARLLSGSLYQCFETCLLEASLWDINACPCGHFKKAEIITLSSPIIKLCHNRIKLDQNTPTTQNLKYAFTYIMVYVHDSRQAEVYERRGNF